MLLYHLPHRTVQWEGIDDLTFPLVVKIEVTLSPPELFGEAEFTDSIRDFPDKEGGQDIVANFNLFEGLDKPSTPEPVRFDTFEYTGNFGQANLHIHGTKAVFDFQCNDMWTFRYVVQSIIEQFPPSFSCATMTPVSIVSMTGNANSKPFQVTIANRMDGYGLSIGTAHPELRTFFDQALPSALEWPIQVISAIRYLSQSVLLHSVSRNSYYFCGERVLNLCKAIEAITADYGETADDLRTLLGSWSVHRRYIEIFVTVKYLRSNLDVGHRAYSHISEDAFRNVIQFVSIAERATKLLIKTAIKRAAKDPATFKNIEQERKDPPFLKHLAKHLDIMFPSDGNLEIDPDQSIT